MQVALDKITEFWGKTIYEIVPHKSSDTKLVKMDDETFELMQEH